MATRKDVATQFKRMASTEKDAWIVGKATFTEEIANGPMKDVRVVTVRADFSKDLSADSSSEMIRSPLFWAGI